MKDIITIWLGATVAAAVIGFANSLTLKLDWLGMTCASIAIPGLILGFAYVVYCYLREER